MHWLKQAGFGFGAAGVFAALTQLAQGQPANGTETRPLLALPLDPPLSEYTFVPVFPGMRFAEPVALASPPGETNRLFVVERGGRIMVIPDLADPTTEVFLDLSNRVTTAYLELGLLGLAFHPGYATNRTFFVYYTTVATRSADLDGGLHNRLSRFQTSAENPNRALPDSEAVLLSQPDDSDQHNAGDLQFGSDGYLYVSLGADGPPLSRRPPNPQALDSDFFGCILRIDVDRRPGSLAPNAHPSVTTNYAIPPDNPFIGVTSYQGLPLDPTRVRTEIFAHGFRNPWRMSFDSLNGRLYVGDVGGTVTEEINVVTSGGNYGWPYFEGTERRPEAMDPPAGFQSIPPWLVLPRGFGTNEGNAVIGGIVYRGGRLPGVEGHYIFGDNVNGHVSAVPADDSPPTARRWLTTDRGLSAFGRDPRNGDVLLVNVHDGQIKRLEHREPSSAEPFPSTLVEVGAFSDLATLTPRAELIPYTINVPFWSDQAIKTRWFCLPEGAPPLGFNATNQWSLPAGTVWVKHFELELTNGVPSSRRRLETRFLVRTAEGAYGVTYRWGESLSNATLVPAHGRDEPFLVFDSGTVRTQVWRYPGRLECLTCHTRGGGFALAFNTAQLNCDAPAPHQAENQLSLWRRLGYLALAADADPLDWPVLAHHSDTNYSIGYRARSYLAANCAHCHQPGAAYTVGANWDARPATPLAQANLLGRIVVPQAPFESTLLLRLENIKTMRMPPLATDLRNADAISLVIDWMRGFPSLPWHETNLGPAALEGDASVQGDRLTLSAAGSGIDGSNDEGHYLFQAASGNAAATVRWLDVRSRWPGAIAGLMFRESGSSASQQATLGRSAQGALKFQWRDQSGGAVAAETLATAGGARWLRLVKDGAVIRSLGSADGTNFEAMAEANANWGEQWIAGVVLSSQRSTVRALAEFDRFSLLSVRLAEPTSNAVFTAGDSIHLAAGVEAFGTTVERVGFLANGALLGERTEPPFAWTWSPALAGSHQLTAHAVARDGTIIESTPVPITAGHAAAGALTADAPEGIAGSWLGAVGSEGVIIADHYTNLPAYASLTLSNSISVTWQKPSTSAAALQMVTETGRIASAWTNAGAFSIQVSLLDGAYHAMSLYFLDGSDGTAPGNGRAQLLEIFDQASGDLLRSETVADFASGRYRTYLLRGQVTVRLTALNAGGAVLSGIFFDAPSSPAPRVDWLSPADGQQVRLPAKVTLSAAVAPEAASLSELEFLADGVTLGRLTTPPYELRWSNVLAGPHTLEARGRDALGRIVETEPRRIMATLPTAHASFRFQDVRTQGSWTNAYGRDGFLIVDDATNLPPFISWSGTNDLTFTWAPFTTDSRAVQRYEGGFRIAATTVDREEFTVEAGLLDGQNHQWSLYLLDWDEMGRSVRLEWSDATSGQVLDQRVVESYYGGRYLAWVVRGHVRLRVTRLAGPNIGYSGWFLDPLTNAPPSVLITSPSGPIRGMAPTRLSLLAEAADPDGIERVEFVARDRTVATATLPPYEAAWPRALAGVYDMVAKATDRMGLAGDSPPLACVLTLTNSSARFLVEDTLTQGDWVGTYGSAGIHLAEDVRRFPPSVTATLSAAASHVWAGSTPERRALRRAGSVERRAACWAGASNLVWELRLDDGWPRRLALYCLDWDSGGRSQRVSLYDASLGTLLDARDLPSFADGRYLVWEVRGHVRLVVELLAGGNAVASGLFLDPLPTTYDTWRQWNFSPDELQNLDLSADEADPDRDGRGNFIEYATAANPRGAELQPPMALSIEGGHFTLRYRRSRTSHDVVFSLWSSSDLSNWQPADALVKEVAIEGADDGESEVVVMLVVQPVVGSSPGFFRLTAGQSPVDQPSDGVVE